MHCEVTFSAPICAHLRYEKQWSSVNGYKIAILSPVQS